MKSIITLVLLSILLFITYGCKKTDNPVKSDTNSPPSVPVNPFPPDSATGIDDSSAVILSWECSDPDINDTLKFDVFIGTNLPLSDVPIASNLSGATYNMGMLPFPGTQYFWQIKAKDNHGASSTGNIWRFTIRTRP